MLIGYDRRCSTSGMFVGAKIDDTLRRKPIYSFTSRLNKSCNILIVNICKYKIDLIIE